MKIAFVGITRDYSQLTEDYIRFFNKYHLEIPFYYAELGGNDVTVVTPGYNSNVETFESGGTFKNISELYYNTSHEKYDVVIHWRKWFDKFYKGDTLNLLHTCDHSYSQEWKNDVLTAFSKNKLYGILCYKTWHQEHLFDVELNGYIPRDRFIDGMTFGVDTTIYKPSDNSDPRALLWSSDPGRGLMEVIPIAIKLWQRDKRYKLHVCYPDYVKQKPSIQHPSIVVHGNVPNGPKLWKLFSEVGTMPYTSTFREPSSRAFRQAQAAGNLVLYPPDMGTPSRVIEDGTTGFVRPVNDWIRLIFDTIENKELYNRICKAARQQAENENWQVQANRFNERIKKILGE
jgi:glycosyltransferase involved in cell wall biosynthesis